MKVTFEFSSVKVLDKFYTSVLFFRGKLFEFSSKFFI